MTRPRGPDGRVNLIEFWLLVGTVLQGATVLTGVAVPATLRAALDQPLRSVWALLLMAGGALALAGLKNVVAYRVGLAMVATGALTYGTALALYGSSGYVAALLNLSLAVACVAQIRGVTQQLSLIRTQLQTGSYSTPHDPE
jgi:hypothetical protein